MSWMKHTVILGLPRTGKTTFAIRMFSEISHTSIFINTQLEDFNLKSQEASFSLHYDNIIFNCDSLEMDSVKEQKIIINDFNESRILTIFERIFKYQQMQETVEPITIFIDEAHVYFPYNYNIDDPQNVIMKMLFTRGAKYNIRLVLITQKPQLLCPRLYTLCERLVVFKLHANDYSYFRRHHLLIPKIEEQYQYQILE